MLVERVEELHHLLVFELLGCRGYNVFVLFFLFGYLVDGWSLLEGCAQFEGVNSTSFVAD